MPFYDISLPIHPALAVWPGDKVISVEQSAQLANGDTVNLGAMTVSLHAGTHADAPYHFERDGQTVDAISPEVFVGPVLVWDVSGCDPITVRDFEAMPLEGVTRILLRTGAWTDHARFPESIPVISLDVPAYLESCGVRLLGLDVPSVDPIDSKDLANHHALARHGVHILESLDLSAVEPGRYQLSALPLRVVGADAAPVRAVLWRD